MSVIHRERLGARGSGEWMRAGRPQVVADTRADLAGQVRFALLLMTAVAMGSVAVAAQWDLPNSWLVPQWLLEWLMPRVP